MHKLCFFHDYMYYSRVKQITNHGWSHMAGVRFARLICQRHIFLDIPGVVRDSNHKNVLLGATQGFIVPFHWTSIIVTIQHGPFEHLCPSKDEVFWLSILCLFPSKSNFLGLFHSSLNLRSPGELSSVSIWMPLWGEDIHRSLVAPKIEV